MWRMECGTWSAKHGDVRKMVCIITILECVVKLVEFKTLAAVAVNFD